MTEINKLRIGLALKEIAILSDEFTFDRIKGKLKEIEQIITDEPDTDDPEGETQKPRTGHWIWKDFDDDTGISKSYWCSECNKPLTGLAMDYCGCCGARMESEG